MSDVFKSLQLFRAGFVNYFFFFFFVVVVVFFFFCHLV